MLRFLLLLLAVLLLPLRAAQAELLASAPVNLPEARLRLLAERAPDGRLTGGIEITLVEGFKTYWKNPGDSGVPPRFDFSASRGARDLAVRFPLPVRFDDGAGGTAFGYKARVIFPFEGHAEAQGVVQLSLDFAVCGTLCIPHLAQLTLDLAKAAPAGAEAGTALAQARAALPKLLGPEGASLTAKEANRFELRLPYDGAVANLSVFPDAPAFFEVSGIEPDGPGMVRLRLVAQPQPGRSGLGPLSLTYGTPEASFERVFEIDLKR